MKNENIIIIMLITFLISFIITKNTIQSLIHTLIIYGLIITYKKIEIYLKTKELFSSKLCKGCYCMKRDPYINIIELLLVKLENLEKDREITRIEREFITSQIYSNALEQPQIISIVNGYDNMDEKLFYNIQKDEIKTQIQNLFNQLDNDKKIEVVDQIVSYLIANFRSKYKNDEIYIGDY